MFATLEKHGQTTLDVNMEGLSDSDIESLADAIMTIIPTEFGVVNSDEKTVRLAKALSSRVTKGSRSALFIEFAMYESTGVFDFIDEVFTDKADAYDEAIVAAVYNFTRFDNVFALFRNATP